MIVIKDKKAIEKMSMAGKLLSGIFQNLNEIIKPGISTAEIDSWISLNLVKNNLKTTMLGYCGYRHVSCISLNDEVVHGIPSSNKILNEGDLIKVDVCASWNGYCADMARSYMVSGSLKSEPVERFIACAHRSLKAAIDKAIVGNRISDISAAVQAEVEASGYGVVREFAGHGIGKKMHEDPEILNYGKPGRGAVIMPGMAFAIEPMITMGNYKVYIASDGWTVKTVDGSLAMHVEDTVVVTDNGPMIITLS